jgi:hypothetical protein
MSTGFGQTFTGQINNQYEIKGQMVGARAYILTWRKPGRSQ